MDVLPQASLFLGVIPALMILYIGLKGYDGYYKDKYVFLSFVAGIIFGFIAAFVQSLTLPLAIIYIVLLSFFDQLFKTIILNMPRLHGNIGTPIYGMTLGLGFGSSFTPFMIIATSAILTSNSYVLILTAVGSLGVILFHGATGAYIGLGIFYGRLFKHLIIAILLQLPFNFLIGMMVTYSNPELIRLQIIFVIGMILYGCIVYYYITKKLLPVILEKGERRKRSKR